MRLGKISLAALAAASLISAPVMAQSLSPTSKAAGVSKVKRVGAAQKKESKLGGDTNVAFYIAAAVAIAGLVIVLNDDDGPTSP